MQVERVPIWTRAFRSVCSAVFLAFGQYAMLLVVIPLYVTHIGGSPFLAGLVLLTYSLPSFVLRPLIGYWADSWSVAGVLALGSLLMGLSGFFYLLPAMAILFLASAARGLGWAGFMTGGYTVVATIAPDSRRGEVSGYYNTVMGSATVLFPALGLWMLGTSFGGYHVVFVISSLFALLSAGVAFFWLAPALRSGTRLQHGSGRPAGGIAKALFDRGVLLATVLNLCSTLTQPAVTSFLPLYAHHQGISQIGWYFVLSGIAGLVIRPVVGRAADKTGRGVSILAGLIVQGAGFALIAAFGTLPAVLLGGILNAFGVAVVSGATMALAMDLADPARRGTAMGTYSLSYQVGAGLGAVLAGAVVSLSGYQAVYVGGVGVLAAGTLLTLVNWPKLTHTFEPTIVLEISPGAAEGAGK
ncbi:MAG: MFS transporter [Dehalococcoidia bacterium]